MRAAGRPGRGERARVAARVRELLAQHAESSAARTFADQAGKSDAWLPDDDFERHVPRHESRSGAAGRPVLSRLRWDPGRRGAAALGVLLVAVIAATGWWLAAGRPHESALPASSVAAGAPMTTGVAVSAAPSASASFGPPVSATSPTSSLVLSPVPSSSASSIVVDVAGRVRRPGLYTLAPGARVDDAVEAAGGVRLGVHSVSLNLAQPITDGAQIVVGRKSGAVSGGVGAVPGSGATGPDPAASGTIVNLNTATLTELETLPGIGPVLGQQILDWRSAHGQFTSVQQLEDVSGIGDARYAEISPLVTV